MRLATGLAALVTVLCAVSAGAQGPPCGATWGRPGTRDCLPTIAQGPLPEARRQTFPDAPGPQAIFQLPAARPVIPPPPTLHDRFNKYLRRTYEPSLLLPVLADSAYSHVMATHNQFGSDAAGFGERLGASTGMTEFHLFLEHFALAAAFHQDPSFQPSHVGTARQRALYAITRVGIARGDDGRPMFNYALVISGFAGAGLANAFEPDERRTVGNTMGRALTGLASNAGMNLGREFWPEIRGVVRRHEPRRVRDLQQRVQGSVDRIERKP